PGRVLTYSGTGSGLTGVGAVDIQGTLLKTNTGTLQLGGGVTYSVPGTIDVRQGTLFVDSTAHFATSTYNAGTLAGGTWRVQNAPGQNAAIGLGSAFPVSTIGTNATVELNGPTSYFDALAHGLLRVDGTFRVLGGNLFPKDSTGFVVPLNGVSVFGTVQV